MCRYAGKNYKQSYACFKCKKAFKKTNFWDYLRQHHLNEIYARLINTKKRAEIEALETRWGTTAKKIEEAYQAKIAVCPDCGGFMANLGMDVRSPRKTNRREWKILEGMYTIGMTFQSCGCDGVGYIPKNTNDYKEYLVSHLKYYQSRVVDLEKDEEIDASKRSQDILYWQERIGKVSAQLMRIA